MSHLRPEFRQRAEELVALYPHARSAMLPLCHLVLAAPSDDTPLIQQVHITAAHAICEIVERNLFKK